VETGTASRWGGGASTAHRHRCRSRLPSFRLWHVRVYLCLKYPQTAAQYMGEQRPKRAQEQEVVQVVRAVSPAGGHARKSQNVR
jgi:hypothetical protein